MNYWQPAIVAFRSNYLPAYKALYLRAYKAPLHLSRTLYKSATFYAKQTQFPKKSNDVSFFYTMDYENKSDWTLGENKPNSNPIKANFKKAKMNVNSLITKDYRKKDDFSVRINKPNSNPISVKPKMNVNLYVIEDYENETAFRPKKTNPIQTQFLWIPAGVYPAQSLPRTSMRGCGAGMTMREDNA